MSILRKRVAGGQQEILKRGLGVFYRKERAGQAEIIDDYKIEPLICAPTLKGIQLLCAFFSTQLNIQMIFFQPDTEQSASPSLTVDFSSLRTKISDLPKFGKKPLGVVMSTGSGKFIPIVFSRFGTENHMTIFDGGPQLPSAEYRQIADEYHPFFVEIQPFSEHERYTGKSTEVLYLLPKLLQASGQRDSQKVTLFRPLPVTYPNGFIGPKLQAPNLSVLQPFGKKLLALDPERTERTTVSLNGQQRQFLHNNPFLFRVSRQHTAIIETLLSPR